MMRRWLGWTVAISAALLIVPGMTMRVALAAKQDMPTAYPDSNFDTENAKALRIDLPLPQIFSIQYALVRGL